MDYSYKLAVIKDRKGDISKRWYVEFFVYDKAKNDLVRKQIYLPARLVNKKERMNEAVRICEAVNKELVKGNVIDSGKEKTPKNAPIKRDLLLSEGIKKAAEIKMNSTSREHSISNYRMYLKALIDWINEAGHKNVFLKDVDAQFISSFFDWLDKRKPLEPRSYNNYIEFTKRFFTVLVEELELIPKNPVKIKRRPEPDADNFVMNDDEKKTVLDALKKYHFITYVFAQFIYYSFLRPSELRELKIGHILPDKLFVPGKSGKMYGSDFVVITHAFNDLINVLDIRNMDKDLFVFGRDRIGSRVKLSRNYMSQKHRDTLKELKMNDRFELYSWKDTGLVDLYNVTNDIHFTSKQARHHSLEYTQIYLQDRGAMLDFDKAGNTPKLPV